MDRSYSHVIGSGEDRKRNFPDLQDIEDDNSPQPEPKRSCHSFPTGFEAETVIATELFSAESWSVLEASLRSVVREVAESKIQSHFQPPPPSSSRKTQLNDQAGGAAGSETMKLKLCFQNQMPSTIFTSSEIEAKDGKALQVALCDASNSNAIVKMGPLSSAQIEIVVLNGDFGSSVQQLPEGTCWTVSDFNKSVLHQREGKRPIIVGHDLTLFLKQGVVSIRNLSFTDNSRWTRPGKFRLGARIKDPNIAVQFSRITEAISEPFKVMDHRGEVNKKHHPPNMGDEVWRLEGIGKGGVYHSRLSSKNISTVHDFLQVYQTNPSSLRQLLGNKVPNKTWKAMVNNALECLNDATLGASYRHNLVENDAMKGEAYKGDLKVGVQINSADGDGFSETFLSDQQIDPFMLTSPTLSAQLQDFASFMLQDPPLLPHEEASTSHSHNHEVGNTSTHSQYYQGSSAWTK